MAMTGTEEGCEVEKEKVKVGTSTDLCRLPPEVQTRIASLLFARDSIVCRRLISKSLTSNLATMAIQIKPQPNPQVPYLVSLRANNFSHFYHPTLMCSYRVRIQRFPEVRIRSSNHGWLLLSTSDWKFFFFEPFSREKIQLPQLPIKSRFASLCFSSPPTSKDSFVLGINWHGDGYNIIRRGEASWTSYSFRKQSFGLPYGIAPLVRNEMCYCLGDRGYLGVFDLNKQQPKWRILGNPYPDGLSVHQPYIVTKNNGEILRVLVLDDKKVECSKFNITKKGLWLEDNGIGNKMLFLSSTSSFMGSTDMRGMHNKIYFPMFHEDALLFYSLSVKRYISFHSDYSSENCNYNVKDFYNNSAWIIPVSSNTLYNTSLQW